MSEIKTHTLRTYDGGVFSLTKQEQHNIEQSMREGKKFIDIQDNLIALSNISTITKIQLTEADRFPDRKALPRGEVTFNPEGPGYKSFLAMKSKLTKKMTMGGDDDLIKIS